MANSNRDALRQLSRKYPASPELAQIFTDLYTAPDMTVAILGAAILEAELEQILIEKFVVKRADLMGQLFQNRGPLMDFHSKIIVANAMGILTSPLAEEMHSVKSIRNAFAHAKKPITFDHSLIQREIEALRIFAGVKETGFENSPVAKEFLPQPGSKGYYILAIRVILAFLAAIREHKGTANEAIKIVTRYAKKALEPKSD